MKRKFLNMLLVLLILCHLSLSSGCWGSREVENLAVVTILAWDRITENGEEKWQSTARIMYAPGKEKSDDQQGSVKGGKELLLKGKGNSIISSILDTNDNTPRSYFAGHISTIVIGERVAREKLQEFADEEIRYPITRPRTYVTVARGEAGKILEAGPQMNKSMAKELKDIAEKKVHNTGLSFGVTAAQFFAWLVSPDRDAVASQIKLVPVEEKEDIKSEYPGQSVIMEGLAVFRGDRLAGWLNKEETRGFLLMTQKISRGQIPIVLDIEDKSGTYLLTRSKSKIEAVVTGDKLSFRVNIKAQGAMDEAAGIALSPEKIEQLENGAGESLRELVLRAIAKAREYDADFLGLAERLHRTNYKAWQQLGENWREAVLQADIEVEVEAKIIRTGKIGKQLQIKK